MNCKFAFLFLLLISCTHNLNGSNNSKPFSSKGIAYIYSVADFNNKIINKKLNNNLPQIAHNKLSPGSLIKLTNPKTNESIILRNSKKIEYPDFYKILITEPIVDKLNLEYKLPLIEVIELKKNKSFVAQKSKIFKEEKKIHSNAPIEIVKIDNISKNKKKIKSSSKTKLFIIIAEFYSNKSAHLLKKRITKELTNFDSNKLSVKTVTANKITLLSGPYSSINLMKNDYIQLKNFGFEELDITTNE
jgi:hypothetical protein